MLRPGDFRRVFSVGRRQVDACFVVIAATGSTPQPRLGLAISRRRARRAVDRNRIKRLVRESFRLHAPALPALDIVVLARSRTLACDNPQLSSSLAGHWQRLIEQTRLQE